MSTQLQEQTSLHMDTPEGSECRSECDCNLVGLPLESVGLEGVITHLSKLEQEQQDSRCMLENVFNTLHHQTQQQLHQTRILESLLHTLQQEAQHQSHQSHLPQQQQQYWQSPAPCVPIFQVTPMCIPSSSSAIDALQGIAQNSLAKRRPGKRERKKMRAAKEESDTDRDNFPSNDLSENDVYETSVDTSSSEIASNQEVFPVRRGNADELVYTKMDLLRFRKGCLGEDALIRNIQVLNMRDVQWHVPDNGPRENQLVIAVAQCIDSEPLNATLAILSSKFGKAFNQVYKGGKKTNKGSFSRWLNRLPFVSVQKIGGQFRSNSRVCTLWPTSKPDLAQAMSQLKSGMSYRGIFEGLPLKCQRWLGSERSFKNFKRDICPQWKTHKCRKHCHQCTFAHGEDDVISNVAPLDRMQLAIHYFLVYGQEAKLDCAITYGDEDSRFDPFLERVVSYDEMVREYTVRSLPVGRSYWESLNDENA